MVLRRGDVHNGFTIVSVDITEMGMTCVGTKPDGSVFVGRQLHGMPPEHEVFCEGFPDLPKSVPQSLAT